MTALLLLPLLLAGTDARMTCTRTFVNSGSHVGQAGWQDAPAGGYVALTEARTVGELVMRCEVRGAGSDVVLDFGGAMVSFAGAASGVDGAGLAVESGRCSLRALRIAGEDWSELGAAVYRLESPIVRLRVVDVSDADALRVDVKPFVVRARRAGEAVRECPTAARGEAERLRGPSVR